HGEAAIDVSARDALAQAAPVFVHRRDQRSIVRAVLGRCEGVRAFEDAPTIVAAPNDAIDLFVVVLAHVGGPQFAALPIEAEAPRIAQSERPNLRPHAFLADEWVIGWNTIGAVILHGDAHDRPE